VSKDKLSINAKSKTLFGGKTTKEGILGIKNIHFEVISSRKGSRSLSQNSKLLKTDSEELNDEDSNNNSQQNLVN